MFYRTFPFCERLQKTHRSRLGRVWNRRSSGKHGKIERLYRYFAEKDITKELLFYERQKEIITELEKLELED